MVGFFTKAETKSIVRPDGKHLSCNSCGLYRTANSPKMEPYGDFGKEIMLIGESPGDTDDIRNKPWQGKDGTFLRKTLEELGINMVKDCVTINAVNCRPGDTTTKKHRKPEPFEIDCCRRIVLNAIRQYKPKVVILLGTSALQSVVGTRWKRDLGSINKWTGFTIPDQELQTWVCPVFNSTYVLREDKPEVTLVWKIDLQRAINMVQRLDFPVFKEPKIHYLEPTGLSLLRTLTCTQIAFDYEITGLKPHQKGHKIVCASVAVSGDVVYAFLMPQKRSLQQPFMELLEDENIKKIGYNIKFEQTWTYNCLHGVQIKNWTHDGLQAAHILDNRTGVTGLKFQTYVNFGVIDYSSEIQPFLEGVDSKNSNSHNRLEEFVKIKENAKKVLTYCAMDSVFTYRLAHIQKLELEQIQLPF